MATLNDDGTVTFTDADALAPDTLRAYHGELELVARDEPLVSFESLMHAASWAQTYGLNARVALYTTPSTFANLVTIRLRSAE